MKIEHTDGRTRRGWGGKMRWKEEKRGTAASNRLMTRTATPTFNCIIPISFLVWYLAARPIPSAMSVPPSLPSYELFLLSSVIRLTKLLVTPATAVVSGTRTGECSEWERSSLRPGNPWKARQGSNLLNISLLSGDPREVPRQATLWCVAARSAQAGIYQ